MIYGMTDDEIVEHIESLGDQINDLEAKLDELQNRLDAANYARADAMALAAIRQSRIEELEQKLAKFEAMTMLDSANYLSAKYIAKIKGITHDE